MMIFPEEVTLFFIIIKGKIVHRHMPVERGMMQVVSMRYDLFVKVLPFVVITDIMHYKS